MVTTTFAHFDAQIAEARKAVLRELLAWERDFSGAGGAVASGGFDDRIYVFTPQATIIDLPTHGTPVDFAYTLHTDLGHRCRGARVDGVMVPLNTPLAAPWHAVKVTGALFHTQGGLRVDPDARVLRPGRTPLPNLYAGGGAAWASCCNRATRPTASSSSSRIRNSRSSSSCIRRTRSRRATCCRRR